MKSAAETGARAQGFAQLGAGAQSGADSLSGAGSQVQTGTQPSATGSQPQTGAQPSGRGPQAQTCAQSSNACSQPQPANQNYLRRVRSLAPPTKHFHNCLRAYIVGGLICCIGQFLRIEFEALFGLSGDELAAAVSMALIFLGCLLTGLGVYDRIGKAAGAGSIVPITGFANSVASPALEFKSEGLVTGLAAKMFTVAGPIIDYGVVAGAAVGLIYYFL